MGYININFPLLVKGESVKIETNINNKYFTEQKLLIPPIENLINFPFSFFPLSLITYCFWLLTQRGLKSVCNEL